ncbi:MAG: primosomal protein N', partial [Chlamydiota bacterium]
SKAWNLIKKGEASIVIGARSAVFSPMSNLGLIIVDEEHDNSYKQHEDMPAYHARNVAVMRGKMNGCTILLGSATPSMESYKNGENGKYILSVLQQRANQSFLPKVHIVNMKESWEKGFTHFSQLLLDKIKERLEKGEQTLLFLNRRGYHTSLICKQCSHIVKCPHCDISLTFHKERNILSCHLCTFETPPKRECPSCHSSEYLQYKGYGTEHIERTLHAIFPDVRTVRVDRDTTQKKESHERLFQEFRAGKADVLIGTQMIVKGLHFPNVTLVGVIQGDTSLHIPDFRSSEYAFQLLTQVAGRSGRSEIPGEVVIQTLLPDHPIIQLAAKQEFVSFYQKEITEREAFSYPPFSHLIKISFSGTSEDFTQEEGKKFRTELLKQLPTSCEVHPLVPSGHVKVQDRFRYFFLIKGTSVFPMTEAIEKTRQRANLHRKIRLFIDVDPLSTFF